MRNRVLFTEESEKGKKGLITTALWGKVLVFAEKIKAKTKAEGILLCGSLPDNVYEKGSDVDLLFLSEKAEFRMETKKYKSVIFDKLVTPSAVLLELLAQESRLSDVLSLSIGLNGLVIEDSPAVRQIMDLAKKNITERKLCYVRAQDKAPHTPGEVFTIAKTDGIYRLIKDGKVVV